MDAGLVKIWEKSKVDLRVFVASKVKHYADPDDVLQDVFVKVSQNQEKLLKAENISHYLKGMVRNAVTDVFRHRKIFVSDEKLAQLPSIKNEKSINESIADCCLQSFMNQLPEKYHSALVEVELNGASQKELAISLGLSHSAIKSRVQRAREKLKSLVLACCEMEADKYGNLIANQDGHCFC